MNKVKREREDKAKTYEQILREGTLLAAKLIEKHDDGILTNSSYCLGALSCITGIECKERTLYVCLDKKDLDKEINLTVYAKDNSTKNIYKVLDYAKYEQVFNEDNGKQDIDKYIETKYVVL